ncbi:hypothetical protein OROMI_017967 [Orobanche minor]
MKVKEAHTSDSFALDESTRKRVNSSASKIKTTKTIVWGFGF